MLSAALGEAGRASLSRRLRRQWFRRGDVVFNEGDRGDCLYVVESGRFRVQLSGSDGHAVTLRIVHPGDWFGELALVHPDHRRTGRVCALEDGTSLVLTRTEFDNLRVEHPGFDRFLVSLLAERLISTDRMVVELLESAEKRVWHSLEMLADEYGDDPIRMSQDMLAQTAGTVRQTANRVLQIGVRDGVLSLRRNQIRILDRAALGELLAR